jgi:hypothetical protein
MMDELRYGLKKNISHLPSKTAKDTVKNQLTTILTLVRAKYKIEPPVPIVDVFIENNVANFFFTDAVNNKYILLSEWLLCSKG